MKAERQLQMVFIFESAFSVICPFDWGDSSLIGFTHIGCERRREGEQNYWGLDKEYMKDACHLWEINSRRLDD